jgi:hypothetical protein
VTGGGPRFREHACKLGLEGVISKRVDRAYAPGNRGIWVKSKCLNREEFVVVGWTDPEGSRQHIGALLLGYYTEDGRLHYAGRGFEAYIRVVGTQRGDNSGRWSRAIDGSDRKGAVMDRLGHRRGMSVSCRPMVREPICR